MDAMQAEQERFIDAAEDRAGRFSDKVTGKIIVRSASLKDLEWISKECYVVGRTLGYQHQYMITTTVSFKAFLCDLIIGGSCLVAERAGELVGMILGRRFPHPLNPQMIMLAEWLWWVPEEYRKSKIGYLLIREFLKLGERSAHCTLVTIRDVTPVSDESMNRMGLILRERTFVRENDFTLDGNRESET